MEKRILGKEKRETIRIRAGCYEVDPVTSFYDPVVDDLLDSHDAIEERLREIRDMEQNVNSPVWMVVELKKAIGQLLKDMEGGDA